MGIRNTGTKTIEGVFWEYVFSNPNGGAELARHRFLTYERIAANKSATLRGESRSPATRVIQASNPKSLKLVEGSVIQCVLYSDNTTWRNPEAPIDACTSLMTGRAAKKQKRKRSA